MYRFYTDVLVMSINIFQETRAEEVWILKVTSSFVGTLYQRVLLKFVFKTPELWIHHPKHVVGPPHHLGHGKVLTQSVYYGFYTG